MTPIEKDKIVALCEKWGLKELNFTKGIFIAEDNSGITVNLRGDNPIVGVTIAGQLHTGGHGNLKAEEYQREIEAIMKSSSKKSQSSKNDKIKSEVKDESITPPKLQKAKCKGCKSEFDVTLDAAQRIYEEYGAIYCTVCRAKEANEETKEAKHEKKKAENEKKEGDNKAMETKITVCGSCGLELSAPRALECYTGKKSFRCAECDEKAKAKPKGDKKMDEKLPAITENKLTIDVIKQYICPTATDAEAYNFLQLCVYRKLNPFLKEAYLIKYGTAPATMVVGKDTFTKKAEESGKLDGFEAGIIVLNKDKQIERRVGVVQFEGDVLVGGWAKVFRKDMKYPFVCEVPLTEYMKYKDGKPQSSWATLPGTMIRKVALVSALREAFTAELGGCYDKSEMEIES